MTDRNEGMEIGVTNRVNLCRLYLASFFPPNLLTDSSAALIFVVQYRLGPDF